jgi:RecA/RadA recombinase
MSLKQRLIKNSTSEFTATLPNSKIYGKKDTISTTVPMVNVALSGTIDGGLTPGLTMLAGPSKHFKTGFSLLMASAFLKKYEEGIVLFYDSEFGTPQAYFNTFNIDMERVVHTPVTNVEELKFDIMAQLDGLERDDKLMIIIDSIGNLASKKEVEDALNEKAVADMTRAKQLKSLFRMVTPKLTLKDIPLIAVNHTYDEIGLFPKKIVSGGTGGYYSSDNIWIIGRQQEKDGKEISGYHFVINIEKSRFVKEKSKIPVTISWENGINRWSGFFETALDGGYITKPKMGWYQVGDDEKMYREKDIRNNGKVWIDILKTTDFKDYIEKKYKVGHGSIMKEEEDGEITEQV